MHNIKRATLFFLTFAAILGSVFLAFEALGLVGNVLGTSDAATANQNLALVETSTLTLPPAIMLPTSTAVVVTSPPSLAIPPKSSPSSSNEGFSSHDQLTLMSSLGSLASSLADAAAFLHATSTVSSSTPVTPTSTPVVTSFMDGWQQTWGTATTTSGVLSIGANASTTGGEAMLVGSGSSTNYIFKTTFDWTSGQTVTLLARYQDGKNNVSCEFTNTGEIYDYMEVNGMRTLLGQGMLYGFSTGSPVTASIYANNDHIQCGLNGGLVTDYLYRGLPQDLLSGGVGISTWDPQPDNSMILVQNFSVTPL